MILIDTNVLLRYPNIINEYDDVSITIRVIEELDSLKKSTNQELSYKSRKASHTIEKNIDKISFINTKRKNLSVDDELIYYAKKKKYLLITNDLNLLIKAKSHGISCQLYKKEKSIYRGISYLYCDYDENGYSKIIEDILQTKVPPIDLVLHNNEFVIIKDNNEKIQDLCFVYQNQQLTQIEYKFLKNIYNNVVKPRNSEQSCLLNLLFNPKISILMAAGKFGTGEICPLIA